MVERFVASGLMKQEYDRVKLHCTLINSLFRKVASSDQLSGEASNDFVVTMKNMDDEGNLE